MGLEQQSLFPVRLMPQRQVRQEVIGQISLVQCGFWTHANRFDDVPQASSIS